MLQHNLPSVIISVIWMEGTTHLLSLNDAFIRLTHKPPLHRSISHMASVWACIKQKPRNLRQVSEQGRTLSSLYPSPPPASYTHTLPADPHHHMPKIIIQVSLCIHIQTWWRRIEPLYEGEVVCLSSSASTRKQEKAPIAAGGSRKESETDGLAGEVNGDWEREEKETLWMTVI